MKFFVALALFAAVASARILPANVNLTPMELAEVEQIMAAIQSPSTDPTTAAMLEEMLLDLLGIAPVKPPINIPAIIDQYEPIHVGPAIIDFPLPEGAVPGPEAPATPPALPAPPAPSTSPLVQIIVNVAQPEGPASPVQVDNVGEPSPVVIVDKPEIAPTPVIVVDQAFEPQPEPVLIGHLPEAVVVSPIIVAPAIVGPEILN